eukprot:4399987-Pleurochrysis_carterae.AAC.1
MSRFVDVRREPRLRRTDGRVRGGGSLLPRGRGGWEGGGDGDSAGVSAGAKVHTHAAASWRSASEEELRAAKATLR